MVRRLRVLFVATEAAPAIQVGGLGDMAGSLALALRSRSIDLRLALPLYPWLSLQDADPGPRVSFTLPTPDGDREAGVVEARMDGSTVWWIDGAPIHAAHRVYSEPAEDAPRFLFFVHAALRACRTLGWSPDIVHLNDWHTAPGAAALRDLRQRDPFWANVRTLLTIHNLPFLGVGGEGAVRMWGHGQPEESDLPAWSRALPLPVGLATADRLSTVSPTYAREIQTPEFGSGLDPFLRRHASRLSGILNGIDTRRWNPATDRAIPERYSAEDLQARRTNRSRLRAELGLADPPHTPLLGIVARMDPQKGIDLLWKALPEVEQLPWDLAVLGSGTEELERASLEFAAAHPGRVAIRIGFDAELSRRIYAAADLMLVPSRYEPCGISQLIAMRYGALPLVRATGGLVDTVQDASTRGGTGFTFGAADPAPLAGALRRALREVPNRRRWLRMQRRAMRKDFSWGRSAAAYVELYRTLQAEPVSAAR